MKATDTATEKRYVPAPVQYPPTSTSLTGTIFGIWLDKDEEVEWHWFHYGTYSRVMGYTITKKKTE